MIKSSVEKMADAIGYDIGLSNDETQANLLNGFCRALINSMQTYELGMQLCSIVEHLDSKSHAIIKEIAGFIELKEREGL